MKRNKFFYIFLLIYLISASVSFAEPNIKEPNVHGQFYDADPVRLSAMMDYFFQNAAVAPSTSPVDVLIVPHAGYVYSGAVAAAGFKSVSNQKYTTIVILAPSHRFAFNGISVWKEGGFRTPLGMVNVDEEFSKALFTPNDGVVFEPRAFEKEHALEVEIPFLQKTFKDFKIVPVVMGQPSYEVLERFAEVLKQTVADRKDVLIVVSTDLSHYHDAETAERMDGKAIDAIINRQAKGIYNGCYQRTVEMCGCIPVVASLIYAEKKGMDHFEKIKYAHSGDVTGDRSKVVGYVSMVGYK